MSIGSDQVDHRSEAVTAMAKEWPTIDALMGGTPAMRAASRSLLPQWPGESDESYAVRLSTATLTPMFHRTITVMGGKPFAKQLTLSEDTPEQIREWAEDIDCEGVNLHSFASEIFIEAMAWGYGGILVDAPRPIAPANGRIATRREQRAAGMRPYFVRVRHDQILGWRETLVNGIRTLTQLRLLETVSRDDGEFGTQSVERIRVLEPGTYRVYERTENSGDWTIVESGMTGVPFVPFVPVYGVRRKFMVGAPALIDLAYLNVKHWQSQSDQDTILHVARVPILFAKGFDENDQILVGTKSAVRTNSDKSDLRFVEHTGSCIDAGRQSLEDLRDQMIETGAELLVAKPGDRTAEEAANDAEANKSELQSIVERFEDSIDLALYYMAQFASLDSGGKVSLFKDFSARSLSEASANLIVSMQQSGLITKRTAIKEQQRRGVLSPDIDPDTELALAEAEGPDPGDLDDKDK